MWDLDRLRSSDDVSRARATGSVGRKRSRSSIGGFGSYHLAQAMADRGDRLMAVITQAEALLIVPLATMKDELRIPVDITDHDVPAGPSNYGRGFELH